MRLDQKEILVIKNAILDLDPEAQVYVYGSRTNDSLKGGDIDILVLSDTLDFSEKITFLVKIKTQIGEQKIDLAIKKISCTDTDPFVQKILTTAVRL